MISVRPLQFSKALYPIEVTEFGIQISDRPEQPENAYPSIEVTELPMVKDINVVLL